MAARRRSAMKRQNLTTKTMPEEQPVVSSAPPQPVPEHRVLHPEPPVERKQPAKILEKEPVKEGYLPITVILEILAREYEDSPAGKVLCRVAARMAEESGVLDKYRARWDTEETDLSSRLSMAFFDRRQSLELIRYHESKGNREALDKEKDKLEQIEGRLLLGTNAPARITEEDLEILENFIKESGF